MGESDEIRQVIERIVGATLTAHVSAIKDELVDQACRQLQALAAPSTAACTSAVGESSTGILNAAVNSIRDSATQVEILNALLDGLSRFCERAVLFVIRAGAATGWRAAGLEHQEGIKALTLDLDDGLASRAYHARIPAAGSAAEFDPQFVSTYGSPVEGCNAHVLPLVIRDKVAALVYADAGTSAGGKLDPSALETLVHCAGMWLEIVGSRKLGATQLSASDTDRHLAQYSEQSAAAEAPQAAEELSHTVEPPPSAAVFASSVAAPEPAFSPAAVAAARAMDPVAAPIAQVPAGGLAPEDEEIHRKARRFAKLLVDEIKLYNQAKVAEGRAQRNVYEQLRADIDKSRAAYDKRYGSTPAVNGNYFTQELIRILANDDPSLLGSGFSG